jgi:hypothetical protein
MNARKVKWIVMIVLLFVMIYGIGYRLFTIEGNTQVLVVDGNEPEKNKQIREYNEKKTEYNHCLIREKYQQDLQSFTDCKIIEAAEEAKRIADQMKREEYNREKNKYDNCVKAERIAKYNQEKTQYDNCIKAERITEYNQKKAKYTQCIEAERSVTTGKTLFAKEHVITGNTLTGSGIWGRQKHAWTIFARTRPETMYIWRRNRNDVTFKYIYTNTTGSPMNAKMYTIADNIVYFYFNGRYIKKMVQGGWPNTNLPYGIGPDNITLDVGENTFRFDCENTGGPAGFAVIVTDANGNLLFNTRSEIINRSGLNDGWQIV